MSSTDNFQQSSLLVLHWFSSPPSSKCELFASLCCPQRLVPRLDPTLTGQVVKENRMDFHPLQYFSPLVFFLIFAGNVYL